MTYAGPLSEGAVLRAGFGFGAGSLPRLLHVFSSLSYHPINAVVFLNLSLSPGHSSIEVA